MDQIKKYKEVISQTSGVGVRDVKVCENVAQTMTSRSTSTSYIFIVFCSIHKRKNTRPIECRNVSIILCDIHFASNSFVCPLKLKLRNNTLISNKTCAHAFLVALATSPNCVGIQAALQAPSPNVLPILVFLWTSQSHK